MPDINHHDGYNPNFDQAPKIAPLDMSVLAIVRRNPRHATLALMMSIAANVILIVDWVWNYAVYS